MKEFEVTGKAMRPASPKRQCFYCGQPIGGIHNGDCVLIEKKVRVRMIVEYEISVPADWSKNQIEFHRNESRWCADNAISELENLAEKNGCICDFTTFEYIDDSGEEYLDE